MAKNKRKRTNHALFHAMKAKRAAMSKGDETSPVVGATTPAATLLGKETNGVTVTPNNTVISDIPGISEDHLAITVQTIQTLVAQPTLFHGKPCKELRRILHPLILEQLQSYDKGVDYRHKVTNSLRLQNWSDALSYLQACHDFCQYAKQGTIQRWVRDCDKAPVGRCQLTLLSAILRLGHPDEKGEVDTHINQHDAGEALARALVTVKPSAAATTTADGSLSSELTMLRGWKWWNQDDKDIDETKGLNDDDATKQNDQEEVEKEDTSASAEKDLKTSKDCEVDPQLADRLKSRILYQEEAAERKPPNHYDLILHTTTEPGSIVWTNEDQRPAVTKHEVPFLSNALVLGNVLTKDECQQIRQAATHLGFRPDHPTSLAEPTGIDSCEWLVDSSIGGELFRRVQPHLPATPGILSAKTTVTTASKSVSSSSSARLHSINNRWRCFRYDTNCVYRPHLDGSWGESGMDEDGNYICDTTGQTKSYWTFLVYLNDNFDGGETRFYLPNTDGDSVMVARGVVPKEGSVLVFPQGNSASLIHEGSAVSRGVKYVIRSDVLYTTRPEEESLDPTGVDGKKEDEEKEDTDAEEEE